MRRRLAACAAFAFFALSVAGCSKFGRHEAYPDAPASAKKEAALYYCPMHPTYTSPKPGTCPICNMNLVPMEAHEDHSGHEMKPTDAQTNCVRHECPMLKAGQECPMLIVSETGETPECPVCKKSITASEQQKVSGKNPEGYAAVALTPAKRQLIGVKTSRVTERALKTSIRTTGLMLAAAEMDLFVYENDLPRVASNSKVKAFFPALGRELEGQVSRIPLSLDRGLPPSSYGPSAILSAASNQVTLRARLEDPDRLLRRGMTADAEVLTDLGTVTALPEEAVFHTGKQDIVFVERPGADGVYEPRSVGLGAKAEGFYAVKSGVKPGETVVTSGNFLIDSESRLKSALEGMLPGEEAPAHAH